MSTPVTVITCERIRGSSKQWPIVSSIVSDNGYNTTVGSFVGEEEKIDQ